MKSPISGTFYFGILNNMLDKKDSYIKYSGPFEVVGRDSRIDMERYTVTICGREIVDYEKLKQDNPKLYKDILDSELQQDLLDDDM